MYDVSKIVNASCFVFFFFLMIRRPPRSTLDRSSAASDVYKRQGQAYPYLNPAALYDAISYYFDHRQEIEAEIRQNRIAQVLADTGAEFDNEGRLTFPDNHGG